MICFGKLRCARSGSTALEFALIASVFLPLCLGILEGGLLLWTQGALQSAAAFTARCAAIASPDCTTGITPTTQKYAVAAAQNWVFPGIISTANVVPTTTACTSGVIYQKVTLTSAYWAGGLLPPPLNGLTLTSVAYFPVATC
jgi:Flp pilus assembly protein TadG